MKTANRLSKLLSILLLAGMAIPAAGALPYAGAVEETAVRVSYADLDLTTESGLRTLYSRLKRAADEVCGPRTLTKAGSLYELRINRQCYSDALSKAVAEIGSEGLDEIHAG